MEVILIGAGNLATNLGKAMKVAGLSVKQVYSRTRGSAMVLADLLETEATNDLAAVKDADVYVLSVKDDALESLIPALAKNRAQSVFLHTAGSMPMDVFAKDAEHYGVFYPMQTFSKGKEVNFREIPCFVESNDEYSKRIVHQLASMVSDKVSELSTEKRKYLHLAAVFACNFTNHCYDLAAQILEPQGIPFDVMLPLIDETARKVHMLSPHDAQTGPAVRYDEHVICAQMALLDDERTKKIYELLSHNIHDRL